MYVAVFAVVVDDEVMRGRRGEQDDELGHVLSFLFRACPAHPHLGTAHLSASGK